ncbi:carboxymuconolactone decarboxylase family protein [Nocardiopsis sp. NPDC050513]|uniref:carboxymuconolactone decarboxylase family protein n=1 Tax=Nocardiopsis sp. NPDC050513 TaxID=3364338 RepID=UPI00378F84E9
MSRVTLIEPASAGPVAAEQLDAVKKALGVVPNLAKALANSPSALKGYLGLNGALGGGELSAADRERVALAVAEVNGCDYCLSAHTYIAANVAKVSEVEIVAARRGTSTDPRSAAVVDLAVKVTETRGSLADEDLAKAREAGLSDAEIVEVVAGVALNVLTNYVNKALDVDIEWPVAKPLAEL